MPAPGHDGPWSPKFQPREGHRRYADDPEPSWYSGPDSTPHDVEWYDRASRSGRARLPSSRAADSEYSSSPYVTPALVTSTGVTAVETDPPQDQWRIPVRGPSTRPPTFRRDVAGRRAAATTYGSATASPVPTVRLAARPHRCPRRPPTAVGRPPCVELSRVGCPVSGGRFVECPARRGRATTIRSAWCRRQPVRRGQQPADTCTAPGPAVRHGGGGGHVLLMVPVVMLLIRRRSWTTGGRGIVPPSCSPWACRSPGRPVRAGRRRAGRAGGAAPAAGRLPAGRSDPAAGGRAVRGLSARRAGRA